MALEEIRVNSKLSIPLSEIELRTSRSSGPGGQHANVTASKVEAVFEISASQALSEGQKRRLVSKLGPRATAVAQDSRSQLRNRELALKRLAEVVAEALKIPKKRKPTKPTRASKEKRLTAKKLRSQKKATRQRPEAGE